MISTLLSRLFWTCMFRVVYPAARKLGMYVCALDIYWYYNRRVRGRTISHIQLAPEAKAASMNQRAKSVLEALDRIDAGHVVDVTKDLF
jgi:hypothetical protein